MRACLHTEIDGKLRKKDERSAKAEGDEPYFVRGWIKIIVDEMARALDTRVKKSLAAR